MAKTYTLILGIMLLVFGVVGWIIGGHGHTLIVFGINRTHSTIHVLSGVIAILAALGGELYARVYCVVFGLVYGSVTVAGFLNLKMAVQMLNLTMPDNLLYLGISIAGLAVWFGARSPRR